MANPLFARKPLTMLLEELEGKDRLKRVLGPTALTSMGIGAVIGAGIFVSTGQAAHQTAGPSLMLSGFDAVSTQAEEARNPSRDVPIGIDDHQERTFLFSRTKYNERVSRRGPPFRRKESDSNASLLENGARRGD